MNIFHKSHIPELYRSSRPCLFGCSLTFTEVLPLTKVETGCRRRSALLFDVQFWLPSILPKRYRKMKKWALVHG